MPLARKDGWAKQTARYDARGHRIEAAYFNVYDQPVPDKHGCAKQTATYDDRDNLIEEACMDIDGKSLRFRTRAQNFAITKESAPSSSKKWLSTERWLMRSTSAKTSASVRSAGVIASVH